MSRTARPLSKVHCITKNGCDYPVAVKIAFDDGTVQTYTFQFEVSPQYLIAKNRFEESLNISIGYQYKPKRKNRILWWQHRTR